MHDVHTLERQKGIPSVALVTSAFAEQAHFQSAALGLKQPERHVVLAEHPISDASPAELVAKADALYADLLGELTYKPLAGGTSNRRRIKPTELSAECAAGA